MIHIKLVFLVGNQYCSFKEVDLNKPINYTSNFPSFKISKTLEIVSTCKKIFTHTGISIQINFHVLWSSEATCVVFPSNIKDCYAINGYFGAPTGCQSFSIPIIPANDYVTLDTYLSLYEDFYIIADPNNTILESDKSNNTACSGTFCTSPPIWPGDFAGCLF